MKKLLAIMTLGLLVGCATTNESFNTRNSQNKYIKLALASKTNTSVKIAKADETGIWLMGEKYGWKNVWSVNPNKGNEYFLQTAKNYCSSLKKNTYTNYKKASVARHKWGGLKGDSHYHSQFDYYERGLLIEDKQYWAIKYVCANNKKEALTSPGSWIKREYAHPVTASHSGKWTTNEYKRKLSQVEIVENKKRDLEEKRRVAVLKKKQRDNLIKKLDKIYGKDCSSGLLSKKFEKGTKEYENCLLAEKKSSDKKRVEVAKKLSSMSPKERHAYNCSTAFKFRKGCNCSQTKT